LRHVLLVAFRSRPPNMEQPEDERQTEHDRLRIGTDSYRAERQ
jgi:hypothetical protein